MFKKLCGWRSLYSKICINTGATSRQSSPGLDECVEEDDDVEVDVEECSDSEAGVRAMNAATKAAALRSPRAVRSPSRGSDPEVPSDRDTPDSLGDEKLAGRGLKSPSSSSGSSKVTAFCNCEELVGTDCHLETKELWDKFHDLGTEMIITKTGR